MSDIFDAVATNQVDRIKKLVQGGDVIESRNVKGWTPLIVAVCTEHVGIEIVEQLLAAGAKLDAITQPPHQLIPSESLMKLAIKSASVEKIECLIHAGMDVTAKCEHGYGSIIDAVCSAYHRPLNDVKTLIRMFHAQGAELTAVTSYGESPLSVSSYAGFFDLVLFLIKLEGRRHDNYSEPLYWSPLHWAVMNGKGDEVKNELSEQWLEARDGCDRTPFFLAVSCGNIEAAQILIDADCDQTATGNVGISAIGAAAEQNHVAMLNWLVERGFDVHQTDHHGRSPIIEGVERDCVESVRRLLELGVPIQGQERFGTTLVGAAISKRMIQLLEEYGADLSGIPSRERKRFLFGKEYDGYPVLPVTAQQFHSGWKRQFGGQNPTHSNRPFWEAMVRERCSAFSAKQHFGVDSFSIYPVWCCDRFGQSLTRLPDGSFVEIAGEHEDGYDPDFCIYNDVIVYHTDGQIDIWGYNEAVFPPTDFHTATLTGEWIYIIGSLGYTKSRRIGETPVYRVNISTWAMEKVETKGDLPGWVHKHHARLIDDGAAIEIWGGDVQVEGHKFPKLKGRYVLTLKNKTWKHFPDPDG